MLQQVKWNVKNNILVVGSSDKNYISPLRSKHTKSALNVFCHYYLRPIQHFHPQYFKQFNLPFNELLYLLIPNLIICDKFHNNVICDFLFINIELKRLNVLETINDDKNPTIYLTLN